MLFVLLVLFGNIDDTVALTTVEQTLMSSQRPLAIVANGSVAAFTQDYELLIFDGGKAISVGGQGQGPGEFQRGFRSLYFDREGIVVTHTSGTRNDRFSREGALLESHKQPNRFARLRSGDQLIEILSPPGNPMGVDVIWQRGRDQDRQHLALGIAESDLVTHVGTKTLIGGETCLIYTDQSRERNYYYQVIDFQSGQIIAGGQERLIDSRIGEAERAIQRIPNATVPVLEGCSYSPEFGFVLTEHTIPQDYRILRILNPQTGRMRTIKVIMPRFDVIFFQHLEGDSWMGYSESGDWIRFQLEPSIFIAG